MNTVRWTIALAAGLVLAATCHAGIAGGPGARASAGNYGAIANTYSAQNSPQDKLQVQVSVAVQQEGKWVSYVKVVWGDLDNLIPRCSPSYYSNWDGSIELTGATGQLVRKIQFEDSWQRKSATRSKAAQGPQVGTGRDQMITTSGAKIEWKAAVVGVLDGVVVKITSDTPDVSGVVKAGAHSVAFASAPASAGPAAATVNIAPVSVQVQPASDSQSVTAGQVGVSVPKLEPVSTGSAPVSTQGDTQTTGSVGIKQIE
jgi:hypothetical protein